MGRGKHSKTNALYSKYEKIKGRLEDSYERFVKVSMANFEPIKRLMNDLAKYSNKTRALDSVVIGLTDVMLGKYSCTSNRTLIKEPRLCGMVEYITKNSKLEEIYNATIQKLCHIVILLIDNYIKYYEKANMNEDKFCKPLEKILQFFERRYDNDLILVYLDDELDGE
jgi:hypothetical protein